MAGELKAKLATTGALGLPVLSLAEERHYNTFFRLQNPAIIAGLREKFPDLPEQHSPREVFVHLRKLRNQW